MKKVPAIIAILVVLGLAYLLFGAYRSSPLHGKLKAASVTMTYFSSAATNSDGLNILEKAVTIQNTSEVSAIEQSLMHVRSHLAPNSMEGLPKYRMKAEYADGSSEQFVFTRTEWGGGGLTPPSLLEILMRNGL